MPGFQATVEAYQATMTRLGRHLIGLIALALKLPREHFEPFQRNPMPVLRLLHYPPQSASRLDGQIGSGAHTDWGGLTLLAQDESGGLQVRREGESIDVPPMPGTLVVNLGDLMQRWTNDRYCSIRCTGSSTATAGASASRSPGSTTSTTTPRWPPCPAAMTLAIRLAMRRSPPASHHRAVPSHHAARGGLTPVRCRTTAPGRPATLPPFRLCHPPFSSTRP